VKGRPKTARSSPKKTGGHVARSKSARQVRQDLAVEFYSLLNLALGEFGLTKSERRKSVERASRLKAAPRVSGPILRDAWALSALLAEWSRDALYLDDEGKPRILEIEGPGMTFESLAQRFLPNKPLRDVVAMACEASEVVTRPGDRIALLGSVMVSHVRSPERALAFAVRQFDQVLQTTVHNFTKDRTGAAGRMQRMALGIISRDEFEDFMRELRPQIYDLLTRAESSFERRRPVSPDKLPGTSIVSIGVYVAQEEDFERAGVDSVAQIEAARPKNRR
jgi:hypothetical protein